MFSTIAGTPSAAWLIFKTQMINLFCNKCLGNITSVLKENSHYLMENEFCICHYSLNSKLRSGNIYMRC